MLVTRGEGFFFKVRAVGVLWSEKGVVFGFYSRGVYLDGGECIFRSCIIPTLVSGASSFVTIIWPYKSVQFKSFFSNFKIIIV